MAHKNRPAWASYESNRDYSVTVSTASEYRGTRKVNENAIGYYNNLYAPNALDIVGSVIEDIFVDSATGLISNPVLSFAVGEITSLVAGIAENNQGLNNATNIYTAVVCTENAEDYGMKSIIISRGDSEQIVLTYPTAKTEVFLESVNERIAYKGINMDKYELPNTLTYEVIRDNPDKINKFMLDPNGLTDTDMMMCYEKTWDDNSIEEALKQNVK